eukprot:1731714-Pleurochrysis_carterae.AAC.1
MHARTTHTNTLRTHVALRTAYGRCASSELGFVRVKRIVKRRNAPRDLGERVAQPALTRHKNRQA